MSTIAPQIIPGPGEKTTGEGLRFRYLAFVFLVACAVFISRRPDAVFHAQFFAEDGSLWFADAYNQGWWRVLFYPYEGYLHILPRLACGFALLVPMAYAPLIENLIAIAIQALPVCLILSARSQAWGPMRFRAGLAFLYLILPNTREMMGVVTESQWIVALCALLVMVGASPQSRGARIFDISILVMCSLTGPFCIFLFPIALFLLWRRPNNSWLRVNAAILSGGFLIQGACLTAYGSSRQPTVLGASFKGLFQIAGGQIFLGTLLGGNMLYARLSTLALASIVVAGSAVYISCAIISGMEMRILLLFSALVLAASLMNPVIYPPLKATAWEDLAMAAGAHYWFFPCLAFAWSLAGCLRSKSQLLQIFSACLLFLMAAGVIRDYGYPAFADLHFASYARQVEASPRGSKIVIPENPNGWTVQLYRH